MKLPGSLVFYIGNGVVKAGIVAYEKNKPPRIVSSRIRKLPHFNERDREHLEKRILFEFGEMVRDVKMNDLRDPAVHNIHLRNARVIVSSPWYISETAIIKMKEPKPFVVTEQLLNNSRESIIKAYRDAHELDVTVLEQKVIRVSLNGYPTNDPIRKKAETLDMTVFTSFARHSSVEAIKESIEKNFHLKSIDIHSQSLVAFSVVEDTFKESGQYILADITSQLTELVAVRKNVLSEAASFPLGKQFLVKVAGEKLGVASEVAESLIKMANEGSVDESLKAKLDDALAAAKKEWLTEFSAALAVMSSSSSLPSKFFLFAPTDVSHIFRDFIMSEEYQQFSFAEGKFEVHDVSATDLLPFCKNDKNVEPDISLMLCAVFDDKMKIGVL